MILIAANVDFTGANYEFYLEGRAAVLFDRFCLH